MAKSSLSVGVRFRTIASNAKIWGGVRLVNSAHKTDPFLKKHKLFCDFTNITIKMVTFYPNSISSGP